MRAVPAEQEEAARGDGRPMLAPHGPALSVQLRRVRLRLREFLALILNSAHTTTYELAYAVF